MANIPRATYRLQFNSKFTFQDALAIVEYLAALNISHIYASPYFTAVKGSMHGYDIADPTKINPEIGGENGYHQFYNALKANDLDQIVDIVPNHMTTKCPDNIWWMNVLKYGLASPYFEYFDLLRREILLPVLEEQYEKELDAKKIQIKYEKGSFYINYISQIFPISIFSIQPILLEIDARLKTKFFYSYQKQLEGVMSSNDYVAILKLEQNISELIKHAEKISPSIEKIIDEINNNPKLLDAILAKQNYKLVFWRTADTTISYRRFFHLNSFVGMRMEDYKTFLAVHELLLKWIKDRQVDGIRIDHIDGLRDPVEYLNNLRNFAPDCWKIVEKILLGNEIIPNSWLVQGTTGYDFLNNVTQVFVDSSSEKIFTDFYVNFIGGKADYYEVLREKKLFVLRSLLGGEVIFLTELLQKVCAENKICFAFSQEELSIAIQELIACFPVYRTYIRALQKEINEFDKKIIIEAINLAKKIYPESNIAIFGFLQDILLLKYHTKNSIEFVMRFQQLTGPAMAKGEEDTAFYCYNRFVVLNEVGGDPSIFGKTVTTFHQVMADNAKRQPYSLLATSTHDTKRSEDVRARLVLLSEIPNAWFSCVQKWILHNEKYHADFALDRNTQYFLYQNLVGAWPVGKERILSFMKKAAREAKTHTSWFYKDLYYEQNLANFVNAILKDPEFCSELEKFVTPLIKYGRINSLAQTAIKLTAPGVPDFYQGTEFWNLDFVDPDNRRQVDWKLHLELFHKIQSLKFEDIMEQMDQGMPKFWLIQKTLALRKQYPNLFDENNYSPIILEGEKAIHGIAYLRGNKILTLVPRLIIGLKNDWQNTHIIIPKGKWKNILTDEEFSAKKLYVKDLLQKFPVAVLFNEQ